MSSLEISQEYPPWLNAGIVPEALEPFGERLRCSGVKIAALSTDMPPTYINAGLTHFPEATLVLDHFQVIKLYHDNCLICKKNFILKLSTGCETGDQGDWLAAPQASRQSR